MIGVESWSLWIFRTFNLNKASVEQQDRTPHAVPEIMGAPTDIRKNNPSKKESHVWRLWGFDNSLFKISRILTSFSFLQLLLQTSPPASDSDQTTFPQGRVYRETFLTKLIGWLIELAKVISWWEDSNSRSWCCCWCWGLLCQDLWLVVVVLLY
jgi:hypothetical protein